MRSLPHEEWAASLPAETAERRAAGLPHTIARHAVRSLHAELVLYPKPGLVSPQDKGSHHDMDSRTFMNSLFTLRHYFRQVAQAGILAAPFVQLAVLGLEAEQRMLAATAGVNTHRGAIFCLGLLCAAAGRAAACIGAGDTAPVMTAGQIRRTLCDSWGADLVHHARRRPSNAHGSAVAAVHGVGGARAQAAAGMPAVFDHALPALQGTLDTGRDWDCAKTDALFVLMAELEDTNVYHRGGACGAAFVRAQAREFLARGGTGCSNWRDTALRIHRRLVERRLSPGGAADLLAATCFVHQLTRPAADGHALRSLRHQQLTA